MYTSDPSGQFSLGRLISDRMSYKNHYMCSGKATSIVLYNQMFSTNTNNNFNICSIISKEFPCSIVHRLDYNLLFLP